MFYSSSSSGSRVIAASGSSAEIATPSTCRAMAGRFRARDNGADGDDVPIESGNITVPRSTKAVKR